MLKFKFYVHPANTEDSSVAFQHEIFLLNPRFLFLNRPRLVWHDYHKLKHN